MMLIARKIKTFKKVFTKGEQRMIILGALVGMILGICLMVLGVKIIHVGVEILLKNTHSFLLETFGFGLY